MKLRRFEIDAIVDTIYVKIKNNLKIPTFDKEVKERERLFKEYSKLFIASDEASKTLKDFCFKHGFGTYRSTDNYQKEYDEKTFRTKLVSEYIKNNIPQNKDLENDIILSGNKDLAELVEELTKKYTK